MLAGVAPARARAERGKLPVSLLERVTAELGAASVPWALIGAAALAVAGVARSTYDIDLLTTDLRVLGDDMWAGLRASGIRVDVRRGDASDPLAGVVRFEAPGERPLDLIVGRHAWQAEVVNRAVRAGRSPAVVRPPDLVLLKLYAGGDQDLWDIRALLDLPGAEAWGVEVEAALASLPDAMRRRWTAVRSSFGVTEPT